MSFPVLAQVTETVYLSGTDKDHTIEWDFFCTAGRNSGVWTKIPVPSNWELHGFGTYNYGHDKQKGEEKGLYKYRFQAPSAWVGKRVFLVFEGSMTDTEVSINGKSAGPVHQGGFYRFKYDVTGLLDLGAPNLLSVTVSKQSAEPTVNDAERTSDYWVFGGIFRPVYLEAYPAEFIERIAINAKADGTVIVDAYLANIRNATRLVGQVRTLDGSAVGQPFEQPLKEGMEVVTVGTKIPDVQTWSAETPNLYQVELRLKTGRTDTHFVTERFGFRTVELRAGDGIYVNGRKVRLKGVNRHSFWPDSGRTTSRQLSIMDVNLMKDMNMNAVRMSHYPPDSHFLEVCDTVGLYVLDELGGWQKAYGTEIGEKLVKETVVRDVNHPSVIIWDNGNEGGWNRELDDDFARYDPQKRHVIHPWENFNYTDTGHYRPYGCCPGKFFNGKDVLFPTEFLHGLYDGGGGAGLEDYWALILSKPFGAGGFLWAFIDEGVKRTDKEGILDTDGNHAPDGLLGPYREKEGSFFAVKEVWSPVVVKMESLPPDFAGEIELENRYDFTNLSQCKFSWKLVRFRGPFDDLTGFKTSQGGTATAPLVGPWSTGKLSIDLPPGWRDYDALLLTARDPRGREIYTWTWMIQSPRQVASTIGVHSGKGGAVTATEDQATITMRSGDVEVTVEKWSGLLRSAKGTVLTNGPVLASGTASLSALKHYADAGSHVVEATYEGNMRSVKWRLQPNGWLRLDYEYEQSGDQPYLGVSFDYPEAKVKGMRWLGRGPYRVWKNRLRGVTHNVWTKPYNDTKTGFTWQYPEFKGFHADTFWAVLDTEDGPLTVVTEDEGVFLRILTPSYGPDPRHAAVKFPAGSISFLQGIAPIGTKFNKAENLGPQGQSNQATGRHKGTLYFYFAKKGAS
ncbi:MAG: glycoside hydrolase family 2 [Acidobacteria bacterium]|nr:MAG: glycoside hydrolase family 2 [Acidobacteriota bacterium]